MIEALLLFSKERGAGSMGLVISKLENTDPTLMWNLPNHLFLMISHLAFSPFFMLNSYDAFYISLHRVLLMARMDYLNKGVGIFRGSNQVLYRIVSQGGNYEF